MAKRCIFTQKSVMSGNNVSHAQNKTRRTFLPNMQKISFISDLLDCKFRFRLPVSTIRSIEKNGGIDNYILKLSNKDNAIDPKILQVKKRLVKKLAAVKAA